jgi:predicted deacylase
LALTDEYFPTDYFAARSAFRVRAANAEQNAHPIAAPGPNGEALSINSAYLGSPTPRQLVVITSGIHGVEGYAGSALQQLWLAEFAGALPADTGVLLVHALNPYGFAHNRRANEHNVDLNRNALANFPGPANPGYRSLNAWLNPSSPTPRLGDFAWRALPLLLRHGRAALAQAIAAGQYEFPQGLFYGGREREPSLAIFAGLLAAPRFAGVQRVVHLDLHTGLGRYGKYQLLLEEPPATREFEHLTRGFGVQAVKSDHASHATHYSAHGILPTLTRRAFPNAFTLAATVEFGTFGPATLLRILRAENRVHHHGARRSGDAAHIRRALRDALAPHDPTWRAAVIASGRQVFAQLRVMLAELRG